MNAPAFRITPALCEAADDREARATRCWLTRIDVEAIAAGLMVGLAFVTGLSWS